MKKIISQITAFALAFCMLAALVPAMPAQAADGDVVLNFATASMQAGKAVANVTYADGGNWYWNESYCSTGINNGVIAVKDDTDFTTGMFKYRTDIGATYLNLANGNGGMTLMFKVEKDGYYTLSNVDAFSFSGSEGVTNVYAGPSFPVNDIVATFDLRGVTKDSGKAAAITDMQKVYLKAGENYIKLWGTSDTLYNAVALKSITFTPYVEPSVEADVVLDFKLFEKVSAREGLSVPVLADATKADGGWVLNKDLTDRTIADRITDTSYHAVYRFIDGDQGARVTFYENTTNTISFDFDVTEAGYYDLSGTVYGLISEGAVLSRDVEVYVKSSADAIIPVGVIEAGNIEGSGWIEADMPTFKTVYLSEGTNTIMLKSDSAANNMIAVSDFSFTKVGDAAANDDEVFGNIFAYVKNTAGGTTVSFVGGIKNIEDFEEVGFKVDGKEYTTKNVYEKLTTSDGATLTAADFGAEGGYIFHTAPIAVETDDVVTIQAIAKGVENAIGRTVNVTIK